jgi:hypothetical protein
VSSYQGSGAPDIGQPHRAVLGCPQVSPRPLGLCGGIGLKWQPVTKLKGRKEWGVGNENKSIQLFERSPFIVPFEPHMIMFQTPLTHFHLYHFDLSFFHCSPHVCFNEIQCIIKSCVVLLVYSQGAWWGSTLQKHEQTQQMQPCYKGLQSIILKIYRIC